MAAGVPILFWYGLDDVRKGIMRTCGDMVHTEVVRGDDAITFTSDLIPAKYDRLLWWDSQDDIWREHIVVETKAGGDGSCSVVAHSTLWELKCDFAAAMRFENVPRYEILDNFLPITRFTKGTSGNSVVSQAYGWFTRQDAYKVMRRLEEIYGVEFYAELVVDEDVQRVVERRLSFKAELGGWRGLRFTRGKNLPEGYVQVCADEVVTALYGYGTSFGAYDEDGNATGGYTRRLTFGSVNGGIDWVGDEKARELYGRKNADGTRRHNFGYVIFDDEEYPSSLLIKTSRELQKRKGLKVRYALEDAIDVSGRDVRLGEVALVCDEIAGAPYRAGMRVVERKRVFGRASSCAIKLGEITAGTYSAFSAYERRCGRVDTFEAALVAASLKDPDGSVASGALSVRLELKSAKRSDGSDIDLRYAFDFLEGDVFRYVCEVENNLSVFVSGVAVDIARAGISEAQGFMSAGEVKTYAFEVSPTDAEITAGSLSVVVSASCPQGYVGTSSHYEECAVDAQITLPLTSIAKPVSIIPDDLTGDGTFENPYTVADLRRCWCASTDESTFEDVWLCGYIVGWADMSLSSGLSGSTVRLSASGASASNIVLADSPSVTDATQMCAVNLSTATRRRKAVRAALNLADNPGMLGQKVWVYGDVLRYGRETGMKRTDEYRWCDSSGYWHGWNTYLGQIR